MDLVKGEEFESFDRSIDVHISAHPRGHRGQSQEAAAHYHRACRGICIRQGAGLMLRLYLRFYIALFGQPRAVGPGGFGAACISPAARWNKLGSQFGRLVQNILPPAQAPASEQQEALQRLAAGLKANVTALCRRRNDHCRHRASIAHAGHAALPSAEFYSLARRRRTFQRTTWQMAVCWSQACPSAPASRARIFTYWCSSPSYPSGSLPFPSFDKSADVSNVCNAVLTRWVPVISAHGSRSRARMKSPAWRKALIEQRPRLSSSSARIGPCWPMPRTNCGLRWRVFGWRWKC